jgi:glycosyltransferase involved in cell wall biosynthesis
MVRKNRYDLIHAVEESAFIAAAMQRFAGVPYVYDMDSSLAEQLVDAYPGLQFAFATLRRCEAVAVRRSLGVLTVCAALEDVAHGHAPDKPIGRVEDTTLLPTDQPHSGNGHGAESLLQIGVDGASPVAMYVGNLEHYQGIGLLLEGFRHALIRVPSAHLVIVGGLGDDIAHYGRRAAQLGISSRVHFLGQRPISALEGLFRRADVLVSPRLKGLNTPMKIYSYLDSGTAVLATRLRTHTQVLDDRTAYLVEPDPEALGDGLAELLSDPVLRERLASQAKAYVQQEFTPEAAHRKLKSFYTMMESKASGAGV